MTGPARYAKAPCNGSWPETEPSSFATAPFKALGPHRGRRAMLRRV